MKKKKIDKLRIATYLEKDLFEWVIENSKKERITESAFIRQCLAKIMGRGQLRLKGYEISGREE